MFSAPLVRGTKERINGIWRNKSMSIAEDYWLSLGTQRVKLLLSLM